MALRSKPIYSWKFFKKNQPTKEIMRKILHALLKLEKQLAPFNRLALGAWQLN